MPSMDPRPAAGSRRGRGTRRSHRRSGRGCRRRGGQRIRCRPMDRCRSEASARRSRLQRARGGSARASPASGSPGSRPAGRSACSGRVAGSRSRSGWDARWASGSALALASASTSAVAVSRTGALLGRPPCPPDRGALVRLHRHGCDAIRRCEGEQPGRLLAEFDLRDLGRPDGAAWDRVAGVVQVRLSDCAGSAASHRRSRGRRRHRRDGGPDARPRSRRRRIASPSPPSRCRPRSDPASSRSPALRRTPGRRGCRMNTRGSSADGLVLSTHTVFGPTVAVPTDAACR